MRTEPTTWSTPVDAAGDGLLGPPRGTLTFTLLGQLEVLKGGTDHAPTAPKPLQLMAMLLMRAGKVVEADSIIRELWADDPPRSVRTTMQTYIYQLRRCIEQRGLASDGDEILITKYPGYLFRVEPAQIDVFEFRQLFDRGRQYFESGRYTRAAGALRSALSLWSGPPMANVSCGPILSAYAVDLQEQRHNALQLRIQAEMEAGLHRDLIAELRSLVTVNPLDEGLHLQLMQVLSRSGRRLEALTMYRELRTKLIDELALEPCDELQRLHRELLSAGR